MFRSYCQVSIRCGVHTGEADSVEKRHNFLYMLRTIIDAIICDHTALHHNPWAKSDQLADFQLFSTIATFCVSKNLVLFLVSKHVLTILNVSRGPFCSSPIAVVFQLPGWCLMVACLALAAGVGWQHGLPLQDQVPHRASPPGVFRPMAPWPLPAPWRPHGGTLSREKCQVWLDGRECQHPQQVGRTEQDVPCGPADADLKMGHKMGRGICFGSNSMGFDHGFMSLIHFEQHGQGKRLKLSGHVWARLREADCKNDRISWCGAPGIAAAI